MIATTANADTAARDTLVLDNRGLVHAVVNQLRRRVPLVCRLDYDDAVGAGMIGLVNASHLYNPGLGWKFSTYAVCAIRNSVLSAARHAGAISLPTHSFDGGLLAGTLERAVRVVDTRALPPSDRPPTYLGVEDPGLRAVDDTDHKEVAKRLAGALVRRLPNRERRIIRMLYREGLTLTQAARRLGVSKEYVRQLRVQAVATMRGLAAGRNGVAI